MTEEPHVKMCLGSDGVFIETNKLILRAHTPLIRVGLGHETVKDEISAGTEIYSVIDKISAQMVGQNFNQG